MGNWNDIHSLIGIVVIGILVGWLASKLVHGKGMGILPDMVVGILGAFIGGFLGDKLHIHVADGFLGTLALSLLGAVVLLVGIRLIKPSN
jgi:uncharacterized membrane protein YeaQ/YmgE (transglycosylase-associated protein family)